MLVQSAPPLARSCFVVFPFFRIFNSDFWIGHVFRRVSRLFSVLCICVFFKVLVDFLMERRPQREKRDARASRNKRSARRDLRGEIGCVLLHSWCGPNQGRGQLQVWLKCWNIRVWSDP